MLQIYQAFTLTSYQSHILGVFAVMSMLREKMVASMEEIFVLLKHIQQENNSPCEFVVCLQSI